ncbi:hypothetical protein P7C71_g4327, partial [Lecanoromycetidae sp. Uapishka_2]
MATSRGDNPRPPIPVEDTNGSNGHSDPFAFETPTAKPSNHRYSSFDTQLFALNHPSSSPAQAKKALEAHLAETDRRIQETSKLGTTLVQQRQNLSQRIRDVGSQDEESQITPELRQKLVEIEREYNEVGRQSARAFLGPRSESTSGGEGTPFALDGRNPTSPTKFSSQATDSPSKVNVPRRERNRVSKTDDIEFAAEITTSLLGQVRHLQAVLAERDEALKSTNAEKSRLELEAEGFSQRLRSLDESEQRYKDENWNLETQIQETNAAAREAAIREKKLQQTLVATTAEKNSAQKELDDLKQDHTKITEDYAAVRKSHESELAGLRKSVNMNENEKDGLQRKIEELTSQNKELAVGLAGRFRDSETEPETDTGAKIDEYPFDLSEREHSPPPSPTKGVQRHSVLESETLKSSLNHAHRMIQNLKGNVHREKSEKQELKRMLQEARDELEIRRAEPNEKRLKSKSITDIRKTGRAGLGQARSGRTDIMVDDPEQDPEWEDHNGDNTLKRLIVPGAFGSATPSGASQLGESSDAYQTANETEDAFETANERENTDNDAFETGAESMRGEDSDEMTETESGVARGGTMRGRKPSTLATAKPGDRRSIQSTASTSDDEDNRALNTPVQSQPQRFRLKMNRGSRKSRQGSANLDSSNPSSAKNSPASFLNGGGDVSQSLYNELENTIRKLLQQQLQEAHLWNQAQWDLHSHLHLHRPQGYQAPTDPRMIQAITQTMIGEMMWKYTRKAGRGEMSNSRHRRFFWVHPYTRTLYWSDRDPATAKRAELKSKSVAIEAVRVVTDDNPMPPGLHRKSLIIVTPGRSVKFTAQTSQRHETWFNALSYLLLRTNPDGSNAAGDLTDADVDEFNPQSGYHRNTSRSRVSLASFRSNRTGNRQDESRLSSMAPPAAASAAQSETLRARASQQDRGSVRSRISRSLSRNRSSKVPEPTDHSHPPTTTYAPINTNLESKHGSMASRISGFGGSVRNSMRSRSSMRRESQSESAEPGVLEGGRNVVSGAGGDSAEDLRRVIEEREKGEREGRLEN